MSETIKVLSQMKNRVTAKTMPVNSAATAEISLSGGEISLSR
jgi:hypothetical protein